MGLWDCVEVFILIETETDKKWVIWYCVQVFTLTETETDKKWVVIGLCLCQCEHLYTIPYNPFSILRTQKMACMRWC